MSGKQVKRERKMIRGLQELAGPLLPIIPDALMQIGEEGPDLFAKWISIALSINEFKPDLPLQKLLPNVLDKTIAEMGPEIEEMMSQIEDTP